MPQALAQADLWVLTLEAIEAVSKIHVLAGVTLEVPPSRYWFDIDLDLPEAEHTNQPT